MTQTRPARRRRSAQALAAMMLCATAPIGAAAATAPAFDVNVAPNSDPQLAEATEQPPAPKPAGQSESGKPDAAADAAPQMTLDQFLDRLMMAESGGRATAKNLRSTALGPFQFIASTWLQVARRALATEIAELAPQEVLALRTDPALSRRAAKAYTEANAAYLVSQGHAATFPHLRLAFLVGPGGAARVLAAKSDEPVAALLGAVVIGANPFMTKMTTADLIARCAKDIEADPGAIAGVTPDDGAIARAKLEGVAAPPAAAKSKIAIRCELSLPSCRRWVALQTRKGARSNRASDADKKPAIRR